MIDLFGNVQGVLMFMHDILVFDETEAITMSFSENVLIMVRNDIWLNISYLLEKNQEHL